ncbi:MAG TPA: hypothetical protein DCP90_06325 [Clostridiales bacterium]|nr:MAG: hypothetical protein A2Y22_00950 [Clostridiales bacterium GWD2_32_59]HAN10211.1 hypothetical protein [Clostridiales bacterium]
MDARMDNYHAWVIETDADILKSGLLEMLKMSEFAVLGFEEDFQSDRYMAAWILGESHLAIHVFLEDNETYVELTSCIKEKSDKFKKIFESTFKLTRVGKENETHKINGKAMGNYDSWIKVTDPNMLKKGLKVMLEESKFLTSKFIEYKFQPEGHTAVWMLNGGHLAIHTFPDKDKTYVQLSSGRGIEIGKFTERFKTTFEQTCEDPPC